MTRRRFLQLMAALVAALALGAKPPPKPKHTPRPAPTPRPTASPSPRSGPVFQASVFQHSAFAV